MRARHTVTALLIAVTLATPAWAQSRGQGHMAGVVKDEAGQAVDGVQVKAVKAGEKDVFTDKTNKKGEWAINGIAGGQWNLDFSKDGYEARKLTVPVDEFVHVPPMNIAIKKAIVKIDPNAEIKSELERAAPLLEAHKYADARAIYEALLQKYPDIWRVEPLIARTYAGENKHDEAIAHLQTALQHDANNIEVRVLLASELSQQGKTAEAQTYLDGIDMSQIKDPVVFLNQGINLINQGKAADALPIFEKVVAAFPKDPDGVYYRARCELAVGKFPEAKADLQKFIAMPGADAAEVDQAKKILEQMK